MSDQNTRDDLRRIRDAQQEQLRATREAIRNAQGQALRDAEQSFRRAQEAMSAVEAQGREVSPFDAGQSDADASSRDPSAAPDDQE